MRGGADPTHDADANMLSDTVDNEADGVPDAVQSWTWDWQGNMRTDVQDFDADGLADETLGYTYDADGHVLTTAYNGTLSTRYAYDARGRMVTTESFWEDGTISTTVSRRYGCR